MIKIAVVTGASKGVGLSTANNLIESGYKVYGLSRSQPPIQHDNFVWLECDLLQEKIIQEVTSKIEEEKVDLLVNNAGMIIISDSLEFDYANFETTFRLNFVAPILMCQHLLGKLSGGLVINISSISDRIPENYAALYSASKAALNIYFDSISTKYRDFRIYNILPSFVDTPLLREEVKDPRVSHFLPIEWDKIIKPEDIAELVVDLTDQTEVPNNSRIVVVTDYLASDAEPQENLIIYNTDHQKQFFKKQ
jgi:short-subunit dehydrogenase